MSSLTNRFFIDRRRNPKDKSLGNRQRFLERARSRIKDVVDEAIKERNVADIDKQKTVSIPTRGINEPKLRHSRTGGMQHRVLPGNKEYQPGDQIKRPNGQSGGQGKEGSDSGEGEDDFQFTLTGQEFLEIFFEDLELPNLQRKDLKEMTTTAMRRAGHTVTGSPTNLNVLQTMRRSLGRRIALHRASTTDVLELQAEIEGLEKKHGATPGDLEHLEELREKLAGMERRRMVVPFIDPIDIRFNNFESRPEPHTAAVMFCVMDVSASMGEREKELAKRFFILLHLFLKRHYGKIDLVFVRHTHVAQEVDEETFFYSRESGGTVVSTGLAEVMKIVEERYPPQKWNIYVAQASDGENFSDDASRCISLLNDALMPVCQYYSYIEIADEREMPILMSAPNSGALWQAYSKIVENWPNFAMNRISNQKEIYPVFHELFSRHRTAA